MNDAFRTIPEAYAHADKVLVALKGHFNQERPGLRSAGSEIAPILSRLHPIDAVGKRYSLSKQAQQLSDGLSELIKAFDDHLTRFKFAGLTRHQWEKRYIFPRPNTVARHIRQLVETGRISDAADIEHSIINRDYQTTEEWVRNHVVTPLRNNPETLPINYILGEVGSGKSSFNKYLLNYHFKLLKSHKTIVTRVERKKLQAFLGDNPTNSTKTLEAISGYVRRMLVRDCLFQTHYYQPKSGPGGLNRSVQR